MKHICISDYVGNAEILTTFLPDIVTYILILVAITTIRFLFVPKSDVIKNEETMNDIIETEKLGQRIKKHFRFNAVILGFSVITVRSEEHTSELQSHSFISYAVFCLKKKRIC